MNEAPSARDPVVYPAATLMLVRDGADGVEVLMVKRHAGPVFSNALVFPGGRVDAADGAPALIARCRAVPGLDTVALLPRITAIRECYEEAHLLLARAPGSETPLDAAALARLEARHAASFAALAAGGDIELATDLPVPFAHWITPAQAPKRFDTLFFLAAAPADQVAAHDGREAVASLWTTPARAVAEAEAGNQRLVFATRMCLAKLGQSRDVAGALAAAAAAAHEIAPICPEVYQASGIFRIRIPAGLGYDATDVPMRFPPG